MISRSKKIFNQIKLFFIFRKNFQALESVLDEGASAIRAAAKDDIDDSVYFLNILQFCVLFNYDINTTIYDLQRSKSDWKKRLYARFLALSIVEFFEDINQLLGKEFRIKIRELSSDIITLQRLNVLGKTFNNMRSTHEQSLKQIRNAVIAHKEHDTMFQLEIIRGLDLESIKSLSVDIVLWLNSFAGYLKDIIYHKTFDLKNKAERV